LTRELGGTDLPSLQAFYRDAEPVARIAGFARAVLESADRDDVARAICDEAAEHLAAAAAKAVARLPDAGSRVSWSGRLLEPGEVLHTRLAAALAGRGLTLLPPVAGPLEGGTVLLRQEEPYRSLLRTEN
jgi:N-acetylglucosamine kinase-like BadF-type ATPase